jgi:hypothetical protein
MTAPDNRFFSGPILNLRNEVMNYGVRLGWMAGLK